MFPFDDVIMWSWNLLRTWRHSSIWRCIGVRFYRNWQIRIIYRQNAIVGIKYRPPNRDINVFNENLGWIVDQIQSKNKLCYLLSDYNVNLLNCDKLNPTGQLFDKHDPTRQVFDMMTTNGFFPTITRPNRVTATSAILTDNIFINNFLDGSTALLIQCQLGRIKLQWIFNQNTFFCKQDAFENVVCKILAILLRPQPANTLWLSDARWQRFGWTFDRIVAFYLTAPSHS